MDSPERTPERETAHQPFTPSRFWGAVNFYVSMLAFLLAAIAGPVAVVTYWQSNKARIADRTFDIISLWEDPVTQDANSLLNEWIAGVRTARPDMSDAETGRMVMLRAQSADGSDLRRSLERIRYLLNRVAYCGNRNQCDRILLDDFFCDYTIRFLLMFEGNKELLPGWRLDAIEAFVRYDIDARQGCDAQLVRDFNERAA